MDKGEQKCLTLFFWIWEDMGNEPTCEGDSAASLGCQRHGVGSTGG
jgi:hypothetical protein